MWRDPIVEEVRKARDENARRFNYDLKAIVQDIQSRQNADDAKVVDRSTTKPRRKAVAKSRTKAGIEKKHIARKRTTIRGR